jgi:hypothetical protein
LLLCWFFFSPLNYCDYYCSCSTTPTAPTAHAWSWSNKKYMSYVSLQGKMYYVNRYL